MTIEELDQIAESVRVESAKYDYEINVCMGTGCLSQHSDKLKDALAAAVAAPSGPHPGSVLRSPEIHEPCAALRYWGGRLVVFR